MQSLLPQITLSSDASIKASRGCSITIIPTFAELGCQHQSVPAAAQLVLGKANLSFITQNLAGRQLSCWSADGGNSIEQLPRSKTTCTLYFAQSTERFHIRCLMWYNRICGNYNNYHMWYLVFVPPSTTKTKNKVGKNLDLGAATTVLNRPELGYLPSRLKRHWNNQHYGTSHPSWYSALGHLKRIRIGRRD